MAILADRTYLPLCMGRRHFQYSCRLERYSCCSLFRDNLSRAARLSSKHYLPSEATWGLVGKHRVPQWANQTMLEGVPRGRRVEMSASLRAVL